MLICAAIGLQPKIAQLPQSGPSDVFHGGGDTTCPGGQGIEGVVRVMSGNQMPASGIKRGPSRGVKTKVYVFELTNISQVVRRGSSSYYSSVHTRLVTVADTDSTGHFCVCLPEGRYSLFTRSGEWYFASRRDVDNNLAPAEVSKGKVTQVECHVEGARPPVY